MKAYNKTCAGCDLPNVTPRGQFCPDCYKLYGPYIDTPWLQELLRDHAKYNRELSRYSTRSVESLNIAEPAPDPRSYGRPRLPWTVENAVLFYFDQLYEMRDRYPMPSLRQLAALIDYELGHDRIRELLIAKRGDSYKAMLS